jgi:hypothetical protein
MPRGVGQLRGTGLDLFFAPFRVPLTDRRHHVGSCESHIGPAKHPYGEALFYTLEFDVRSTLLFFF